MNIAVKLQTFKESVHLDATLALAKALWRRWQGR